MYSTYPRRKSTAKTCYCYFFVVVAVAATATAAYEVVDAGSPISLSPSIVKFMCFEAIKIKGIPDMVRYAFR